MIDRFEPSQRPNRTAIGYQRWRSLLFLHWKVPGAALRAVVPPELTLDLFAGEAYVGVVPFVMRGVRPRGLPDWLGFNFLETNVRTYVLYQNRPGVYFFSLEASSTLAVLGARATFGLPYYFAHMEMSTSASGVTHSSRRAANGARHEVQYRPGEPLGPSMPETLQHFLIERYLLFVKNGDRISTGQVHHAPYSVQRAEVMAVHDELVAAAGLPAVAAPADCVHYSEGVDVEIFLPQ